MRHSVTRLALVALLPSVLAAQGRYARATTIGRADSIRSAILNEQRPYLVYTPPSYDDTTTTPQRYPVVYLLDGDAHFHSVSGLVQILGTGINATYAVPEMIVVAIPNTNRMRDLSPTKVTADFEGKPSPAMATTGGMPKFLEFLRTELVPHIEGRYRTAPYRVFIGHSLGGITAINALYTMPQLFNAYVAIDPSLWWDNSVLLKRAKQVVSSMRLDKRVLYVAQANTISPDDTTANPHFNGITQFNAVLEAYNTSGLRYAFKYYHNDDHGSVPLIAEYDALRFIFDGYKLDLRKVLATPRSLVDHYRAVSTQLGAEFKPPEHALRLLGQVALGADSAKAIEFSTIATELYPESYRAWNQLGTLLLARRDTVRARVAFIESLKRNGENATARELLRKIGQ